MENSSKALIIAGAIVVSILIIGLGMYFYNVGSSNTKGVKMSEYEKTQVNTKFSAYEGKLNSNKALELLETVIAYNSSVGENGYGMFIMYANGKSRSPSDCSVMGKDTDISAAMKNADSNSCTDLIGQGTGNATGTWTDGVKLTPSTGYKINAALLKVYDDKNGRRQYYATLKEQLSNKTKDYVGVSYYQSDTGIIRAMIIYDCQAY